MLVPMPVTIHPVLALAGGSQVTVVALVVKPPPAQFAMFAIPTGLAKAWLESPRNAIPAKRYGRCLSCFILLLGILIEVQPTCAAARGESTIDNFTFAKRGGQGGLSIIAISTKARCSPNGTTEFSP